MPTITVANQKGGTGKTTIVSNIIGELQRRGRTVLAVDLDPQATLTNIFGVAHSNSILGSAEALNADNPQPLSQIITPGVRANVDLLAAAQIPLRNAKTRLIGAGLADLALYNALAPARNYYDWIIIDGPPDLEILIRNAITASDALISISEPDEDALRGGLSLGGIARTIRGAYQGVNPQYLGLLWNSCHTRERNVEADVFAAADEIPELKQFKTHIYEREQFRQAKASRATVWELFPSSDAASNMRQVVDEIIGRCHTAGISLSTEDLAEMGDSQRTVTLPAGPDVDLAASSLPAHSAGV